MFKQSTIPIYGGKPTPTYTASSGAQVFLIGRDSGFWKTNVKSSTRWSQIGRITTYPASPTDDWTAGVAAIGNNTLVVANNKQTSTSSVAFGYYLKAGFGYRPISVNANTPGAGTFIAWHSLSLVFANGVFIAGGGQLGVNLDMSVARSTDGINWTRITVATGYHGSETRVVFNNGKFFLSTQLSGGTPPFATPMYKSTDGLTWTSFPAPLATQAAWVMSATNSRLFVQTIGSSPVFYISANEGTNWTPYTPNLALLPQVSLGTTYLHIPDFQSSTDPNYYTSTDQGVTWVTRPNPLVLGTPTINGGKFISVNPYTEIYESTDAITWTKIDQGIVGTSAPVIYGTL